MPLIPGTRLGVYEVVGSIGSGGMGEIYRARDSRLDRFVALKVLPREVDTDPERRERFEREAKTIAALNHPNIVTIHSVERVDDVSFLTMELVEGEPLNALILSGGLPLDRLLAIAIPLVDAIAAAHQKGITHRDLKPANVMMSGTSAGSRVKVLDFGLAKLAGGALAGDGTTALPTALATGEGRVLGTVAYMSPEQAEGKTIDARSDLFSLGVMLYEMATGKRPFTGDTSISIISAIVKDTPAPVTDLNPAVPRELARIVRRALAKDVDRRYQTAKDLRNDLEELKASIDSGELGAEMGVGAGDTRHRRAQAWPWIAGTVAIISIAAVPIVVNVLNRGADPPAASREVRLTALTSTGNADASAISPDGKFVAYVQSGEQGDSVWVYQIASRSGAEIVAPSRINITALTVTPDGSFVDFVQQGSAGWQIWRVPFLGGPARKLIGDATSAPGWSPDGTKMAYLVNVPPLSAERQLVVADADGSNPRVIASRKLPRRYLTLTMSYRPDIRPLWMPDGKSIVVQASDEVAAPGAVQLVRVDVATGVESVLHEFGNGIATSRGMGVVLAPDGRSIFATLSEEAGAPAQVVKIDLPTRSSSRVTNDLAQYGGATAAGDALVTTRHESRSSLWVADASGRGERQLGREMPAPLGGLIWAGPARLVYTASLAGGFGLWSTDVSSAASQLIVPGASGASASADGTIVVFEKGAREIWRSDLTGTRPDRIPNLVGSNARVMPDGSRVFYTSSRGGVQNAWVSDLAGSGPRQFSALLENGFSISHDGRHVAIRSLGVERPGVHILSSEGGEPVRSFAPIRGRLGPAGLRWTPDGRGLAYIDPSGQSIWVQPVDGSAPRPLAEFSRGDIVEFAWSPDGTQLALVRSVVTSNVVLLKGVH